MEGATSRRPSRGFLSFCDSAIRGRSLFASLPPLPPLFPSSHHRGPIGDWNVDPLSFLFSVISSLFSFPPFSPACMVPSFAPFGVVCSKSLVVRSTSPSFVSLFARNQEPRTKAGNRLRGIKTDACSQWRTLFASPRFVYFFVVSFVSFESCAFSSVLRRGLTVHASEMAALFSCLLSSLVVGACSLWDYLCDSLAQENVKSNGAVRNPSVHLYGVLVSICSADGRARHFEARGAPSARRPSRRSPLRPLRCRVVSRA